MRCVFRSNTPSTAATNMDAAVVRIIFYIVVSQVASDSESHHNCTESSDSSGQRTVDCTANRLTDVPVDAFSKKTTRLILSHSTIQVIPADAFRQLSNLVDLDLSDNRIHTLDNASFRGLTNLHKLNLNDNEIAFFPASVFNEMYSLETLTISGFNQRYEILPTLPVDVVGNLRTLSLTLREVSVIPTVYARIPALTTLDFYRSHIGFTDSALLEGVRSSNISSLSFRTDELSHISPGTFSDMPNLRSLMFCCNFKLGLKESIASIAHTHNSNIDTLVLDSVQEIGFSVFGTAQFCSPFWRKIRRLSVRNNNIIAYIENSVDCLEELREIDLSYNYITTILPRTFPYSVLAIYPPKLCAINLSKKLGFIDICYDNMNYDVRTVFHNYPSCVQHTDIGVNNWTASMRTTSTWNENNGLGNTYIQPSLQIIRLENYNLDDRLPNAKSTMANRDNNIRYINISMTTTKSVFTVSILGLLKLHTLDLSYGAIVHLKPDFVDFPNLRNLNISHNKMETASLEIICFGSPKLVDFDVSHNRLKTIAPSTFANNPNIAHIKLGGNALHEVELELTNLNQLETLSLHSNKLPRLTSTFIAELEDLDRRENFTLDIRNNSFVCSCESVEFVRWIQTTNVDVVSKDKLSCTLKNRLVPLIRVSLTELEEDCRRFPVVIVIVSVIAFISCVCVLIMIIVWNRWYIAYRLILCNVQFCLKHIPERSDRFDAAVLYFANPAIPSDTLASRVISQWVINELRPLAEDQDDLKLFIADRDGTAMGKVEQFVYAFDRSDTLVVCITQELLRDGFCMESLRYALASNRPLCQFVFVNFCDAHQTNLPKQLQHLLQSDSGATYLVWNENEADHSDFWRRLRRSLNRGSAPDGCLGRTRRITANAVLSELEQLTAV